jgi:Zn-dependent protease/CBS domain-containing protein
MLGGASSIQLARIFGIRIGASPSWFFVLFILIYGLSGYFSDVLPDASNTTSYGLAVLAAVLFFVSLVLHELGHALVARRSGIGIAGIDLWFFGGIAKMTRDTRSPGEELRVAAAGPVVTLLIVALCVAVGTLTAGAHDFFDSAVLTNRPTTAALALLGWLALINAVLFVFNMIPAYPLDGGRIARAIAWQVTGDRNRGTRFSARLGQLFSWLLVGFGLFELFTADAINGLYLIFLGWFLGQGARGAVVTSRFSDRLDGVTVADLMDAQPVWIPGELSVSAAQDEFFHRYRWPWFPVADGTTGRFLGLLDQARVDGAVEAGQPALEVGEMVEPDRAEDEVSVRGDTPIEALLGSEGLRTRGALMVVDAEDRLCGVITIEQLRRAVAAAAH